MIAFDWHNMLPSYYRDSVPSKKVFEFLLGAPDAGFLNSEAIVDIPCTSGYYERHLADKRRLDELFDITFLREVELAEKYFLSETDGSKGSQHKIICKLTRQDLEQLEARICTKTKNEVLKAYNEMIKDNDGVEDICMIRLIMKQNIETCLPTDPLISRKGPKAPNEGRLTFAAQVRPASVRDKMPRLEELGPIVDPPPTTWTRKHSSSSVAVAAAATNTAVTTTAATATISSTTAAATPVAVTTAAAITAATPPTRILLANEEKPGKESGISRAAAQSGNLEAASTGAGSSNTGIQEHGPRVVGRETKQSKNFKSDKVKSVGELTPEVLSSDDATVQGRQTSAPPSNQRAYVLAAQLATTCIAEKAARKAASPDVSAGLPLSTPAADNDDANVMAINGPNTNGTLRRKATKRTDRVQPPRSLAAPLSPSRQGEVILARKKPRSAKEAADIAEPDIFTASKIIMQNPTEQAETSIPTETAVNNLNQRLNTIC